MYFNYTNISFYICVGLRFQSILKPEWCVGFCNLLHDLIFSFSVAKKLYKQDAKNILTLADIKCDFVRYL